MACAALPGGLQAGSRRASTPAKLVLVAVERVFRRGFRILSMPTCGITESDLDSRPPVSGLPLLEVPPAGTCVGASMWYFLFGHLQVDVHVI